MQQRSRVPRAILEVLDKVNNSLWTPEYKAEVANFDDWLVFEKHVAYPHRQTILFEGAEPSPASLIYHNANSGIVMVANQDTTDVLSTHGASLTKCTKHSGWQRKSSCQEDGPHASLPYHWFPLVFMTSVVTVQVHLPSYSPSSPITCLAHAHSLTGHPVLAQLVLIPQPHVDSGSPPQPSVWHPRPAPGRAGPVLSVTQLHVAYHWSESIHEREAAWPAHICHDPPNAITVLGLPLYSLSNNVIVWDKHSREKCTAAHILALFTDTTAMTSPTPSFAVFEQHVELSQKDQELDPYQCFRFPIAGALYYDRFHPPEVISLNKLMTQFAKTVFIHEPLNAKVAHVLSIFKGISTCID
ncbi:hypothetical protein F5141DRAFT_1062082 [Pisolithus sp. B1]|nr:hypothetical protein F5141DRAFT_1062082 [Pisolithus sp. B1]